MQTEEQVTSDDVYTIAPSLSFSAREVKLSHHPFISTEKRMVSILPSPEDAPTLGSMPTSTDPSFIAKSIVVHIANARLSIMGAHVISSPQASMVDVVHTSYANPLSDATDKALECLDTAIAAVDNVRYLILRKLEENMPAWILDCVRGAIGISLKTSLLILALCWIGIFSYETSFQCFRIFGLMNSEHNALFKKTNQLAEELKAMTKAEKDKRVASVERKGRLNEEIERGGMALASQLNLLRFQAIIHRSHFLHAAGLGFVGDLRCL
jgi:hypothetical protein